MSQYKIVRATRKGSYDGHRRKIGDEFPVRADAKESWFVDVGPAPEGTELPSNGVAGQAPKRKSFIDVMNELGKPQAPVNPTPQPMTLSEAKDGLPVRTSEEESIL
jgi:hypothetical protein